MTVIANRQWPDTVAEILRGLAEWVGIESSVLDYAGAARTRSFYEALGFLALEERTDIWGPGNACLISVKPGGSRAGDW